MCRAGTVLTRLFGNHRHNTTTEMSSATLEAEKFLASRGAYVPKRKGLASKPDAYKFAVEKQPEGINLAGPRLAYHDYESQMQHKCVVLCAFFSRSLTTNGV